jgi:hypothetical protein
MKVTKIWVVGCGYGPVKAINWFFEHVDDGIILEDDCLADISFFNFCSEMLLRYKNSEEVMGVGGTNFLKNIEIVSDSYFFSKFTLTWGWATWKRAWKKFDHFITNLDQFKKSGKIQTVDRRFVFKRHWYKIFDNIEKNNEYSHIWDYQWMFAVWNNNGLFILPSKNLISNIGFGDEATHTFNANHLSNTKTFDLGTMNHPLKIVQNKKADYEISQVVYNIPKIYPIASVVKHIFKKILQKNPLLSLNWMQNKVKAIFRYF